MSLRNVFCGGNSCTWILFVIIILLILDDDGFCGGNNDCGCGC